MHSCVPSSEQIVGSRAPCDDDGRPRNDRDKSGHPRPQGGYWILIPILDRLLCCQFENSCVYTRQHEEDDFYTEEPTAIALLGFRAEEKDAAEKHDDKTKSPEG